jgi:hypothetical protein
MQPVVFAPGMAGQRGIPGRMGLTAASTPGPGRLVGGELLPEIGHQFRKLAVGHAVLQPRHIAEIARHRQWRFRLQGRLTAFRTARKIVRIRMNNPAWTMPARYLLARPDIRDAHLAL